MKPSPSSSLQSRHAMGAAPGARPDHHAIAMKNGVEYNIRSVISDTGSTGDAAYASLIRIALNEKPSVPTTAHAGPAHR